MNIIWCRHRLQKTGKDTHRASSASSNKTGTGPQQQQQLQGKNSRRISVYVAGYYFNIFEHVSGTTIVIFFFYVHYFLLFFLPHFESIPDVNATENKTMRVENVERERWKKHVDHRETFMLYVCSTCAHPSFRSVLFHIAARIRFCAFRM